MFAIRADRFGVRGAKDQTSRLLRPAEEGEEVEILRNGVPVARIVPAQAETARRFKVDRERFVVPEDFDAHCRPRS